MKKIITAVTILLFSCSESKYKFKIKGKVLVTKNIDGQIQKVLADAVAYTDTIYGYNPDSIWYKNSDSSLVTIRKPYKVINLP